MTKKKNLKKKIRARAKETGEAYAEARRKLLAAKKLVVAKAAWLENGDPGPLNRLKALPNEMPTEWFDKDLVLGALKQTIEHTEPISEKELLRVMEEINAERGEDAVMKQDQAAVTDPVAWVSTDSVLMADGTKKSHMQAVLDGNLIPPVSCDHPKPWQPEITVDVLHDIQEKKRPGTATWNFVCRECGKHLERTEYCKFTVTEARRYAGLLLCDLHNDCVLLKGHLDDHESANGNRWNIGTFLGASHSAPLGSQVSGPVELLGLPALRAKMLKDVEDHTDDAVAEQLKRFGEIKPRGHIFTSKAQVNAYIDALESAPVPAYDSSAYYVDVGNIPPDEVGPYIAKMRAQMPKGRSLEVTGDTRVFAQEVKGPARIEMPTGDGPVLFSQEPGVAMHNPAALKKLSQALARAEVRSHVEKLIQKLVAIPTEMRAELASTYYLHWFNNALDGAIELLRETDPRLFPKHIAVGASVRRVELETYARQVLALLEVPEPEALIPAISSHMTFRDTIPTADILPLLDVLTYLNGGDAHPDEIRADANLALQEFHKKHPEVLTRHMKPEDVKD